MRRGDCEASTIESLLICDSRCSIESAESGAGNLPAGAQKDNGAEQSFSVVDSAQLTIQRAFNRKSTARMLCTRGKSIKDGLKNRKGSLEENAKKIALIRNTFARSSAISSAV